MHCPMEISYSRARADYSQSSGHCDPQEVKSSPWTKHKRLLAVSWNRFRQALPFEYRSLINVVLHSSCHPCASAGGALAAMISILGG